MMVDGKKAWYALRRTLPVWSFEENLRELIAFLPKYKVDEVIVKVDTEEFSHGQPLLDWVQDYQPRLFAIKQELEKIGVVYSVNPWITVGHNDRGRISREELPGLRTMVGHDGVECTCCACPLSEVWREHVLKVWTLYAETKPHIIWIEDDIRTFNHQPVSFGCFCSEHLRRFSEKIGQAVTREALVGAITQPGQPHPWRKAYLDMQAEVMNETVAFLAKGVHGVSPDTAMGLMSSGPRNHCLEGRRWHSFAEALADGKPLYSRPPMGNYNEDSLRGFYYSHDSIKLTRHVLPGDVIEQTEVENVPFTLYSKSAVFTFIEMALSFAYGSHGITMNYYDHCGTAMENEPAFGRVMATKKAYLNALAERCQQTGPYQGVRILHHEASSYNKQLPSANYGCLAEDSFALSQTLEVAGISTVYGDSNVVATSGQVIRAFSDEEIMELLGKGLFIDATAACILFMRGFGELIGLQSIDAPVHLDTLGAFSAEEYFNSRFGGSEKKFLTLSIPNLGGRPYVSLTETSEDAEVISCMVDPDANRHHTLMYAFENRLGGRVVVHAMNIDGMQAGPAFNHRFRKEQYQAVMHWLAKDVLPISVDGDGAYPLVFRKEYDAQSIIGFFNLSLDAWHRTCFRIADSREIGSVDVLSETGVWQDQTLDFGITQCGGYYTLEYGEDVPFSAPLFAAINWK